MAVIKNRYPSKLGPIDESEDQTKWAFADGSHSIDLKTASEKSLNDFKLGLGVGEIMYKIENGLIIAKDNPAQISQNNNMSSQNMSQSGEMGKARVLSTGHSILGNNPDYPNGFSTKLLILLLSSFGAGVIAATVYICIHLSKVTIYIQ